jgi:hypothetical protein
LEEEEEEEEEEKEEGGEVDVNRAPQAPARGFGGRRKWAY